jgi:hypothetical protein
MVTTTVSNLNRLPTQERMAGLKKMLLSVVAETGSEKCSMWRWETGSSDEEGGVDIVAKENEDEEGGAGAGGKGNQL